MNPKLLALVFSSLICATAARAAGYSFHAPAGPTFPDAEKATQRQAAARVVPIVTEAFRSGAASVRIPPGDYRFGKENWGPGGVIFALEFADLQRDEVHPFTIDATGATFWFELPDDQAPSCHFCVGFRNCRNVTFKGATIDRATRGQVEGRITAFDFTGNRIELQLLPGLTVPATFNDMLEQRVVPFNADGTFAAPLYALQRGGVHLKYKGISPATPNGRCWVTMNDKALLDAVQSRAALHVGDGISCVYTVSSALELVRSEKLTMEDVRVYVPKAWGAEHDGEGGHTWKNCYFGPRPGTSQWQGGEGFMFNATRHGTTLDHVTMRHTADDTANFHGYWSPVASVNGSRVTFAKNAETQRALPLDLRAGDGVIFYVRDSGAELGRAKITAIDGDTVALDQSAGAFANALAEWPDHECAGWTIQNCDWSDNYQRLLIQSGPGVVRHCRFTRFGSCIELNSVFPYVEGGVPRDITIEDNTFTDINPQPGGAAIQIYAHAFQRGRAPTFHNLTIAGNTFVHPNETVIALSGVDGVRIAGNTFNGQANPVGLKGCSNAVVEGNHAKP